MRIGVVLPVASPTGGDVEGGDLARRARTIEEVGFQSLWAFDCVARGFIVPDPLMALCVAATVTTRIDLGTCILQLPLRNTVETAYRIFTLHHLAEGRLLIGVGAGSTRSDFDAFGRSYEGRFSRFSRELPRLRQLLRSGQIGTVDLTPWPSTLGGPPVLVAAWRGPWVERAATAADGWIASAVHADDAALSDALSRFRDAGGKRAIAANVRVEQDPRSSLDRLHRLREMGFDDAVVRVRDPTDERLAALLEGWP